MKREQGTSSSIYCTWPCSYDAWLHWSVTDRCFLDCDYCFSKEHSGKDEIIKTHKLMESLEATGKRFRISFSGGGEPFMVSNILEACQEITKLHFISFNSNMVHKTVAPFFSTIDPSRVLSVYASCHIKALERKGLIERFIENYKLCKERGIRIFSVAIGHPLLVPEANKYREYFQSRGVELIFNTFTGVYQGKLYPESYTNEELDILQIKYSRRLQYIVPHRPWHSFMCNAGYNVAAVKPNGDIYQCFMINNVIGNIYGKILFFNDMEVCPKKRCTCPMYMYDTALFDEAIINQKWSRSIYRSSIQPVCQNIHDYIYQITHKK